MGRVQPHEKRLNAPRLSVGAPSKPSTSANMFLPPARLARPDGRTEPRGDPPFRSLPATTPSMSVPTHVWHLRVKVLRRLCLLPPRPRSPLLSATGRSDAPVFNIEFCLRPRLLQKRTRKKRTKTTQTDTETRGKMIPPESLFEASSVASVAAWSGGDSGGTAGGGRSGEGGCEGGGGSCKGDEGRSRGGGR